MMNDNIKHHNRYNVLDAWPADESTNAEDFLKKFIKFSYSGQTIEYHGASQEWTCILSSFDSRFENKTISVEQRTTIETNLLETFVKEAYPHFSAGECRLIEVAKLKWDKYRNTGTAFIGRHYGLPTRCVDWTSDPLIALFFACWRDFDHQGVVWWMDDKNFSDAIASQWMHFYGKNSFVENDFERDFVGGEEKDILIRFYYADWMERPKKQKALIILSGQYDVHHDESIYRLGVRKCGRFIIGPEMKSDLLEKLDRWGINSKTLGIRDSCIEKIASDVADQFCNIK